MYSAILDNSSFDLVYLVSVDSASFAYDKL